MSINLFEKINNGVIGGSKVTKFLQTGALIYTLTGCANSDGVRLNNSVTGNTEVALAQVIEYKKVGKHPQVKKVSAGIEVIEYFPSNDGKKVSNSKKVSKPVKYTITNENILKRLGLVPKNPYCKENNLYNAGKKVPSFTCKVEKKDGVNRMIITTK